MILLLENEMSCNTATGEEAAAVLKAIPNKNFMLNWDPGNAAALGSTPYPMATIFAERTHRALPLQGRGAQAGSQVRLGAGGRRRCGLGRATEALQRDGFHYGLSLETHWRGAGTPEASTRISMDGLKKTLTKAGISC